MVSSNRSRKCLSMRCLIQIRIMCFHRNLSIPQTQIVFYQLDFPCSYWNCRGPSPCIAGVHAPLQEGRLRWELVAESMFKGLVACAVLLACAVLFTCVILLTWVALLPSPSSSVNCDMFKLSCMTLSISPSPLDFCNPDHDDFSMLSSSLSLIMGARALFCPYPSTMT